MLKFRLFQCFDISKSKRSDLLLLGRHLLDKRLQPRNSVCSTQIEEIRKIFSDHWYYLWSDIPGIICLYRVVLGTVTEVIQFEIVVNFLHSEDFSPDF